ncbi:MAG: carbamoyl-phosphate synthase domain-containing protein, partial [Acidobacteriota bacterium]|nr:carbamoyl-phosphate synthase domain-containing protein [Acidobacteriota bacterium]
MNAILALENGTWFQGVSAGAAGETTGEVVFNTSMTGYQEILTDPSYAGQIVTMTAPQIGNYGVAGADTESDKPQVAGFVMRDASPVSSNWRATGTLRDYLVRHNIVAIGDVDTRALTRALRSSGVMRGIIATGSADPAVLVDRARKVPHMEGSDLVKDVTTPEAYDFETSLADAVTDASFGLEPLRRARRTLRVA